MNRGSFSSEYRDNQVHRERKLSFGRGKFQGDLSVFCLPAQARSSRKVNLHWRDREAPAKNRILPWPKFRSFPAALLPIVSKLSRG